MRVKFILLLHILPTPTQKIKKVQKIECRYFSEEVVVDSAADTDDDALPLQDLLDVTHHLCTP